MISFLQNTTDLDYILGFVPIGAVVAFICAPLLTKLLYRYNVKKGTKSELQSLGSHAYRGQEYAGHGRASCHLHRRCVTYIFNWSRSFTYVPVGVMLISAALGAIDDLMNIFGSERRSRKLGHVLALIRVHKEWRMRVWYAVTLPWTAFKRLSVWFGSRTSRGVFVHEKLVLQFIAGTLTAWWIYDKLGPAWHYIYFPFNYSWNAGALIIPVIIFIVMFTANAVNIADGMDGLAGGALIITFSALMFLSWINGFGEIAILNATTVGALVAYTYFNIKPARFMMGDVGSLGLGALLAVNAMAIGKTSFLLFLGFIFYVEALSVIIQVVSRYIWNRKAFEWRRFTTTSNCSAGARKRPSCDSGSCISSSSFSASGWLYTEN